MDKLGRSMLRPYKGFSTAIRWLMSNTGQDLRTEFELHTGNEIRD